VDEGALQIYIPYSEAISDIYESWSDRPRITPDSQGRWANHVKERQTGLSALGDLVPKELEIVPTTFKSLRNTPTLRLVVAGYINMREGIYGPFDYRPEPIPERAWFEELLSLDSGVGRP
jgi:hypothetical protein